MLVKLCPQGEATIMLEWHLGREGYLIFQPQTKAHNPITSKQEQDGALIQESQAQLGTQARSSLSWPDKNMAPALWLFSSPTSAGTAPSRFLTVYSSHRFLSAVI